MEKILLHGCSQLMAEARVGASDACQTPYLKLHFKLSYKLDKLIADFVTVLLGACPLIFFFFKRKLIEDARQFLSHCFFFFLLF